MKYFIPPILIILIGTTIFVMVNTVMAEETSEKPLLIFEDKKKENINKQAALIEKFGANAFNKCFKCAQFDLANPFALAACLREVEYCLEEKIMMPKWCQSGFVYSSGRCVTALEGCREQYGQHSYYLGTTNENNKYDCGCAEGFGWDKIGARCIQTACPKGLLYYSPYKTADNEFLHGRCMTRDEACQSEYGEFSKFSKMDAASNYYCRCQAGYEWNSESNDCLKIMVKGYESPPLAFDVYKQTIEEEKILLAKINKNLLARVNGLILLQVEKTGEAWYVYPNDKKKYFLSSPSQALAVMKNLGLGATHEFITGHTIYPDYVLGKILIDTEDYGRAYYIYPVDQKAYYLGQPIDAFQIMQNLGLGITNEDIRKIEVGEID